jgi:iron complex outermembrane receptor protein
MVTGKILDANGMPLSGVTIKAVKSGKMALTGADGSFSLAAAENDMLELSSVGFQKQTVSAKSSTLSVKMSTSVETMGEVVMVGSRRSGRVKTETMAPVDVINVGQATATTGRLDLTSTLNYLAPSFNYNKQTGSDGADHIDLATLRGLGPDQTLVLVNGKRRHQTAFVAVFGTRGRGNS